MRARASFPRARRSSSVGCVTFLVVTGVTSSVGAQLRRAHKGTVASLHVAAPHPIRVMMVRGRRAVSG